MEDRDRVKCNAEASALAIDWLSYLLSGGLTGSQGKHALLMVTVTWRWRTGCCTRSSVVLLLKTTISDGKDVKHGYLSQTLLARLYYRTYNMLMSRERESETDREQAHDFGSLQSYAETNRANSPHAELDSLQHY